MNSTYSTYHTTKCIIYPEPTSCHPVLCKANNTSINQVRVALALLADEFVAENHPASENQRSPNF